MSNAELNNSKGFSVRLASTEAEVAATQRLRFEVFACEMGAQVREENVGIESDRYDDHCQHLFVEELSTGKIIASTRLLTRSSALSLGGFYTESEFSAPFVRALDGQVVELGRTCVHVDYRSGGGIMFLWSGIAQLMRCWEIDYLLGCASVPCRDNGQLVRTLMAGPLSSHVSPKNLRAEPRVPLSPDPVPVVDGAIMPPLLKAYLRLGAWVCGEPSFDEEFGVADVMVLLDMRRLNQRYLRHFLGRDSISQHQPDPPIEVARIA
jgi:putative hemolysin